LRLGTQPATEAARRRRLHEVRTVAAYRDRFEVEGRRTLGEPRSVAQELDTARAEERTIAEDERSHLSAAIPGYLRFYMLTNRGRLIAQPAPSSRRSLSPSSPSPPTSA
jgi:hypothetical protein